MTFGNKQDDDAADKDPGAFYMGRMRPPPEPQRVLPRGLLSIIVIAAFLGVIWYAYPQGAEKHANTDVPVIRAETASFKSAPDDPGGMVVPHQDSALFSALERGGEDAPKVERLLPPQEEPLERTAMGLKLEPELEKTAPAPEAPPVAEIAAAEAAPEPVAVPPAEEKPAEEKPEIKAEAPAPSPEPEPVAKTGGVYVQLGSYSSADKAKTGWAAMQKKHGSQLGGKTMRAEKVDLGVKGVFHRLQAGPFSDAAAAESACAAIKKGGDGCFVVK